MNDLFIGGGGYSGFHFIGALEYIHQKKLLDLKNFYGTSIGALIGTLYISGTEPKSMINMFQKINLEEIVKYEFTNIQNGLLDDSLLDTLISFVTDKYPPDINLYDFSMKTNVNICIYVTNVTRNEYRCLSNKHNPKVRLKDALKASMSIPFLFKPVEIEDELYVDGCCKNLFGSPPKEIYVCGYSIIINSNKAKTYPFQIICSIFTRELPNSTYIINIDNQIDVNVYLNLNKMSSKFIIDMYKNGIYTTKAQLE
jgi:NTE family protein|tara:strand:+ start:2981 stop:3745 length:765 start_codon:yes stop_codon:yes gene_type:complete